MTGTMMVQLYLLAQMRATALVERAMRELGVESGALGAARVMAVNTGLEIPGHSMDTYSALLGTPVREVTTSGEDPYRRLARHYQLPLWPGVLFSVFGSIEGHTSGVGFVAFPNEPTSVASRAGSMRPWRQTEEHLANLLANAHPLDEWYPQKDYECLLEKPGAGLARYLLRFDFALLQDVLAI